MDQLANVSLTFISIFIGASIFALVSVVCGFSPFFDLEYPQALALCGAVGAIAFLLSDIPGNLIVFARSSTVGGLPLVERVFRYAHAPVTYGRVATNGLALAFIISGFIGSDLLLHFRKFFSRKKAGGVPISVWDTLLWLYAETGDRVEISLKNPSRTITGRLDYRSIGSQSREILLVEPHSSMKKLGAYLYVKDSEIESILLLECSPFTFWDALGKLFWSSASAPYTALFAAGMVAFFIQRLLSPSYEYKWMEHVAGEMHTAPPHLASRLKRVFQADLLTGGHELFSLIHDTLALIKRQMPEVDTDSERRRWHGWHPYTLLSNIGAAK